METWGEGSNLIIDGEDLIIDGNKSSATDANSANLGKPKNSNKENTKFKRLAKSVLVVLVGLALGLSLIWYDQQKNGSVVPEEVREREQSENVETLDEVTDETEAGDPNSEAESEVIAEDEPGVIYSVLAPVTNTYFYHNGVSEIAEELAGGTHIEVIGEDGDYKIYKTKSGQKAYINMEDVAEGELYAVYPNAADLRRVLPDSEFEILFASSNNITGHSMYPAIPLLEAGTAEMLREAEDIFEQDGYRIKIYDAYRPKWAQYELYDIVQDNKYIANPYNGNSWHQVGRAVDMSLVSIETGEELEMPTPMHTFNSMANRYSSDKWTEEAKKNVDYMTEVMTSVGFGTIKTEWWHFEYKGQGDVLPAQIDYTEITYSY